jgi:heat shock protein HslJ
MKMRTGLCLIALLVTGVVGVQAQPGGDLSTDARSLIDIQWRLVSFGRVGAAANVTGSEPIILKFASDGRASGSGGCNSFSGTYRVRGDSISFGPLISTRRACTNPVANQQEQEFFGAMGSASRFRLTRGNLSITYDRGRGVLSFVDLNQRDDTGGGPPEEDDPVSMLASYYRLINARDYRRAYRLWESPTDSYDQFVRGFADTERVRVFFEPPARLEGAAGSSYVEVPTILIASRTRGDRTFTGCYVLRRSNVSDNRGWRIYRASLTPSNRGISAPTCQN